MLDDHAREEPDGRTWMPRYLGEQLLRPRKKKSCLKPPLLDLEEEMENLLEGHALIDEARENGQSPDPTVSTFWGSHQIWAI